MSNLESGRRPPSLGLAVSIAHYLGLSADYLLRDEVSVVVDTTAEKSRRVGEPNSPYTTETLGSRLRRFRLSAGLSQVDLSQALGLTSHAHISYMENGRKEPSIELLIQIADYFKVSVDDLVRGTSLASLPDEPPEQ